MYIYSAVNVNMETMRTAINTPFFLIKLIWMAIAVQRGNDAGVMGTFATGAIRGRLFSI